MSRRAGAERPRSARRNLLERLGDAGTREGERDAAHDIAVAADKPGRGARVRRLEGDGRRPCREGSFDTNAGAEVGAEGVRRPDLGRRQLEVLERRVALRPGQRVRTRVRMRWLDEGILDDGTEVLWQNYVKKATAGVSLQKGCEPTRFSSPANVPYRGVVILFHGFTACPQQYFELSPHLAAEGYGRAWRLR